MPPLPAGYHCEQQGGVHLVLHTALAETLLRLGIRDPQRLLRSTPPAGLHGRGPVVAVPLPGRDNEPLILRPCLRGGLLRHANHDLYWGPNRPLRELAVAEAAHRAGIATAEPLAAVSVRALGPLWRCYLATRQLTGYADLPTFISRIPGHDPAAISSLLDRTADAIRRMHEAGIIHGDLNLKNILVGDTARQRIAIIDWDKSVLQFALSQRQRDTNLVRFCRSMAKLRDAGVPIPAGAATRFLARYWHEDATGAHARRNLAQLTRSLRIRRRSLQIIAA